MVPKLVPVIVIVPFYTGLALSGEIEVMVGTPESE